MKNVLFLFLLISSIASAQQRIIHKFNKVGVGFTYQQDNLASVSPQMVTRSDVNTTGTLLRIFFNNSWYINVLSTDSVVINGSGATGSLVSKRNALLTSVFPSISSGGGGGEFTGNLDNIPEGTTNKAFTATEKSKLAGVAAGAGTSQAISTISGLQAALNTKATNQNISDSLNANSFYAGNSKGSGDSIALVTANSLKLKRIAAGSNVTITKTNDSLLTISASSSGGSAGLSYDTTTAFYFDTLSKRLVVKYGNVRRRFYADDSLTLGGGGGGGTSQNLLRYSEEMDNSSVWFPGGITMTANTTQAPDGTTTAETGDVTGDYGSLTQTVTVTPNTQYTFSFYAKRGTAPSMEYSVYNATASSDIVARVNYYSLMNSSTFTRISTTFTTPAGCTSIIVYPMRPLTQRGTVFLWGAQLNTGATAGTYTKTTASAIP